MPLASRGKFCWRTYFVRLQNGVRIDIMIAIMYNDIVVTCISKKKGVVDNMTPTTIRLSAEDKQALDYIKNYYAMQNIKMSNTDVMRKALNDMAKRIKK